MKNIFKCLFGLAVLAVTAACSPDSFDGADGKIPSLEGVEPVVTVDQNLNQVTFSLPADVKGVMPVWIFYENKGTENEKVTYSTVNGLKKIFTKAGDYDAEFKLMNRNGLSDGSKSFTFHIDNTVVNFDKYLTLISGGTAAGSSKEWRIDNSKAGHMACGESGTTGTNWWSASADEKAAYGVYDNRLTFTSDYKYTFNPGESGTMYVNNGCTSLNTTGSTEDFTIPATEQTVSYEFDVQGDDLYLVLPANTQFPYMPNDETWANPRFKIESMTASAIELVCDNGAIAWHFSLTSGAAVKEFDGFKYNSEYNLWKAIDESGDLTTHFYYAPGWAQIADPTFTHNGAEYTFVLPEATTDQWQAQCALKPSALNLKAASTYDFSCILNSTTDINNVTIKLTDVNSGDNYVFVENVKLKAYEDYVFYVSDVNKMTADADCEIFFDFGGNPANTSVSVRNIVVKDHANDDGTVLPSDDDDEAVVEWREADNLLTGVDYSDVTTYYAHTSGWEQIPEGFSHSYANGVHTISLPTATDAQWQAQYTLNNLGVALSADKTYDLRVKLSSSTSFNGVTVKFVQQDDDNVFLTAKTFEVTAFEDQIIELVNLEGVDISNLKIVYDFGNCPENTEITISDVLLQEHMATADELTWDATASDNLWGEDFYPNTFYYAPGWAQIANPKVTTNGRTYTVSLPEATNDQWQAQVTTTTSIATSASEKYDFQVILTSNKDIAGATIKFTAGDDNTFYTADRHALTAYEPYSFRLVGAAGLDISDLKLVLDFGGCAADTEVEVSDIIVRKHI